MASSRIPRVVRAGVPMRMPLGSIGLRVSNGIRFLLTVIPARPRAASAILPVRPFEVMSIRIRWLSVPPETEAEARRGSAPRPAPWRWRSTWAA